jgi:esterase
MQLNFRSFGRGEPLIILHGLFGSHGNWHSVSQSLADQYQSFALDLRNHGESPHNSRMDYPVMADDVMEFMDRQGLDRAHLLGHSLGGKVAMQFALEHPGRVKRLLVLDICPRVYPPHHQEILSALLELDLFVCRTRADVERALEPRIPDLALRRFLLKNLHRDSNGGLHWRFGLREIQANYHRLCEAVPVTTPFDHPTLFLKGEHSDYISETDLPDIRARFPQAQLVTIQGAGHLAHVENRAGFLEPVTSFLHA